MENKLILSCLPHTWIFDVDGTLCIHNGYKTGKDQILDGVKTLFNQIPPDDLIIFITSRKECEKEALDLFVKENGLRYNHIIFDAPFGERILINDKKPSGLQTAYAINKKRDAKMNITVFTDSNL